jgi:hypothetical protein
MVRPKLERLVTVYLFVEHVFSLIKVTKSEQVMA